MFELTKEELENRRHQFGTSNWGGTQYKPMELSMLNPEPLNLLIMLSIHD